ncbi:hypothetical protein O181_049113 [Austropuccinia psidii MF-1]|uniref:Uncharacterized protein n=1 Tax=Austropuccinia psidii MF-1 TaxID=1389203 RepID=A0A9Q3DZ88_9BASI|nr:hypothetical protein [Austropuccinia psidii MF-1]
MSSPNLAFQWTDREDKSDSRTASLDVCHTWLPLAEFANNNAEDSSTKQSPFFTIYERNPTYHSIHFSQDSPSGKLSTNLHSVQKVDKEELESAIRRFKKYADRKRSIQPDF